MIESVATGQAGRLKDLNSLKTARSVHQFHRLPFDGQAVSNIVDKWLRIRICQLLTRH